MAKQKFIEGRVLEPFLYVERSYDVGDSISLPTKKFKGFEEVGWVEHMFSDGDTLIKLLNKFTISGVVVNEELADPKVLAVLKKAGIQIVKSEAADKMEKVEVVPDDEGDELDVDPERVELNADTTETGTDSE